jgi:hypothetical protein
MEPPYSLWERSVIFINLDDPDYEKNQMFAVDPMLDCSAIVSVLISAFNINTNGTP